MYCKNCGNKLNDGDKFCSSCGSPVDDPETRIPPGPDEEAEKRERKSFHMAGFDWDLDGFPGYTPTNQKDDTAFEWESIMEDRRYQDNLQGKDTTKGQLFEAAHDDTESLGRRADYRAALGTTARIDRAAMEEASRPREPLSDPSKDGSFKYDEEEARRTMAEGILAAKNRPKNSEIDKFYTFNKKNEEFQALLDREYERIKMRIKEEDEAEKVLAEKEKRLDAIRQRWTGLSSESDDEQVENSEGTDPAEADREKKVETQPIPEADQAAEVDLPEAAEPAEEVDSAEEMAPAEEADRADGAEPVKEEDCPPEATPTAEAGDRAAPEAEAKQSAEGEAGDGAIPSVNQAEVSEVVAPEAEAKPEAEALMATKQIEAIQTEGEAKAETAPGDRAEVAPEVEAKQSTEPEQKAETELEEKTAAESEPRVASEAAREIPATASATNSPEGEDTLPPAVKQAVEAMGMQSGSNRGANRSRQGVYPPTPSEQARVHYVDLFDDADNDVANEKMDQKPAKKVGVIILDILIVLLILLIILSSIMFLMPESKPASYMRNGIEKILNREEPKSPGPAAPEPKPEETVTVAKTVEALTPSDNISKFSFDPTLVMTPDGTYPVEEAGKKETIQDGDTKILPLVRTVADYYDKLYSRMNKGSDEILSLIDPNSDLYGHVSAIVVGANKSILKDFTFGEIEKDGADAWVIVRMTEASPEEGAEETIYTEILHLKEDGDRFVVCGSYSLQG